ncbi:MAG TPA: superoxide dismutase family protein [Longimicrobium sp.]|nr:superoxide dismutase family protein [Longimicrobium sp.]
MGTREQLAAAAVLALAACAPVAQAVGGENVTLRNAQGVTIGTATLLPATEGVQVVLQATGLPAGVHGVHIHAAGRCEGPDFTSAGPHFNPAGRQHGTGNPAGPHAGDLPNLTVGADGRGTLNGTAGGVGLTGTAASSLRNPAGTALVVHASADDYRTDPSGNSGARIACAVISPAS